LTSRADRPISSLVLAVSSWADPEDPAGYSGVPASMVAAMRELVGTTVPVSQSAGRQAAAVAWRAGALPAMRPADVVDLAAGRKRLWRVGHYSRPMRLASTRAFHARLERHGAHDGLVVLSADVAPPVALRTVTFDDSTLAQAARAYPWPHLRGLSPTQIERNVRWQREVFGAAFACCGATAWVTDSLRADYGVPESRVHVLGRGANQAPAPASDRDWSSPRFLFVGLDWERKNGAGLMAAFSHVREAVPSARLDVVGGHPRLDQVGVTGHGRLDLGSASDRARMQELYAAATVFVMPSLHEPLGLSHIEAAAAGIPSIGSSNGGSRTFIGDTGRLVDPLDHPALVAAMLELSCGELARDLGRRAGERAALFTWRKVAERVIRALRPPGVDVSGLADFL